MNFILDDLKLIYAKLSRMSVIVLILANLLPLYGVIFLGWRTFTLLFLYWFENVIIGVFNVLKMLACQTKGTHRQIAKAAIIPFFCVHYGMFTFVHGIFVFTLFGGMFDEGLSSSEAGIALQSLWGGNLGWIALDFLISHGISFGLNYIKGGEYKRTTLSQLMAEPYGRVVVMHITILGGGFLMMFLGAPLAGLVVMIILKIMLDLRGHVNQHFKEKPEEIIIAARN